MLHFNHRVTPFFLIDPLWLKYYNTQLKGGGITLENEEEEEEAI